MQHSDIWSFMREAFVLYNLKMIHILISVIEYIYIYIGT